MVRHLAWADDAATPLFVCEYAPADVDGVDREALLDLQDETLRLIDDHAVGAVRLGYGSTIRSGLIEEDRSETFWLEGLVQPQATFVGGTLSAAEWDRHQRRSTIWLRTRRLSTTSR
ncbi:hypothetical protein BH20ACT2_BH20ACT2_16090 [soil metagenome]